MKKSTDIFRSSKKVPVLLRSREGLDDELDLLADQIEYRPDVGNFRKHKVSGYIVDAEKCPDDLSKTDNNPTILIQLNQWLKEAVKLGLCSDFKQGGYPKNIWWVTSEGQVFEAISGGQDTKNTPPKILYHGWEVKGYEKKGL